MLQQIKSYTASVKEEEAITGVHRWSIRGRLDLWQQSDHPPSVNTHTVHPLLLQYCSPVVRVPVVERKYSLKVGHLRPDPKAFAAATWVPTMPLHDKTEMATEQRGKALPHTYL